MAHSTAETIRLPKKQLGVVVLFVLLVAMKLALPVFAGSSGTWIATGTLNFPRVGHTATLLANGQVLVASGEDSSGKLVTSAELYNPATGKWVLTGSPTGNVGGPNAALLLDGQVLAVLGTSGQLYNPSTGTWTTTFTTFTTIINPITPRFSSGEVLAVGGYVIGKTAISAAALYDPSTGQFTPESGPCRCENFNGALLHTGEVLVAGGTTVSPGNPYPTYRSTNSAELWDPSTQAWMTTGSLNGSRTGESITVLQNGQALVVGGSQSTTIKNNVVVLATAELYTP